MKRRTVLQILPAVALPDRLAQAAAQCSANGGSRFENYTYTFFSAEEAELAARLMDIVIPGARKARCPAFADLMLSTGSEEARRKWRDGLALFRNEPDLEAAVARAAQAEQGFFEALKRLTVDGYYTSPVGIHEDLQYQGNEHLTESPRCDHPEHKRIR